MSGNKLRVLALVHRHLIPPETIPEGTDLVSAPWRTEYDVATTLRAMGHEVQVLAVHDDLGDIRRAATEWKPHIAFNLLEGFDDVAIFDQNVVSHLELLKLPYTGCNPRGLLLARDKSLSKKLLAYHRIPVPEFEVFRIGRPIRRPKRLPFPLIVKSLTQEASIGISQASVVETRRETQGTGHVHPREHRHRGHRRAVHRGAGALCRHPREPDAAGAAGLGAVLHEHAVRCEADRDRSREVEREVPEEVRNRQRRRRRSSPTRSAAGSSTCASAPFARSS